MRMEGGTRRRRDSRGGMQEILTTKGCTACAGGEWGGDCVQCHDSTYLRVPFMGAAARRNDGS